MTLKSMRIFAATLALAVAAGSGAAQAALVTGHLDPEFGGTSALSGLYFTGTETFTVANDCLALSGFVAAGGTCGGAPAAMNFTGATINFFNEDPTDPGAQFLGTATFLGDSSTSLNPMVGMDVSGGKVVGVQSLVIGTADVTLNNISYLLDIEFGRTDLTFGPGSNLGEYNGNTFTKIANLPPYNETTLFIDPGGRNNPCNISGLASSCSASVPALTTLQTFASGSAPEPAAWAMMLVGVGAVGAVMRRRRIALAVT
jgi:hypothetical protein